MPKMEEYAVVIYISPAGDTLIRGDHLPALDDCVKKMGWKVLDIEVTPDLVTVNENWKISYTIERVIGSNLPT